MFFDSHCHLTFPQLASQIQDILQRCKDAQVTNLLNIGDDIESSRIAHTQIPLAAQYGITMRATAGVHPQKALEFDFEKTPDILRQLASDENTVAIGELGLDYVYDDSHEQYPGACRPTQQKVMRAQLDLARELDLPVVIHNREADEDLLAVVADYPGLRGVFHCFGSSPEVAEKVLAMGFHLGFTGIVTFKNAGVVREVAQLCPLDRMLIETDAPYLAPVPHRGKTNEPSFVPFVAQTIAEVHNKTFEEIAQQTTVNARRLFGLNAPAGEA
jgi:TatD DNase family protein